VRALWEQGLADREIAVRIGVGKNAVFLSRRRQQLPPLFIAGRRIEGANA
jgi:hypothetical protein